MIIKHVLSWLFRRIKFFSKNACISYVLLIILGIAVSVEKKKMKMKMKIDKISIKIDYVIKRLIGLVIMLLITK